MKYLILVCLLCGVETQAFDKADRAVAKNIVQGMLNSGATCEEIYDFLEDSALDHGLRVEDFGC